MRDFDYQREGVNIALLLAFAFVGGRALNAG
jgi:hypothetical protein